MILCIHIKHTIYNYQNKYTLPVTRTKVTCKCTTQYKN